MMAPSDLNDKYFWVSLILMSIDDLSVDFGCLGNILFVDIFWLIKYTNNNKDDDELKWEIEWFFCFFSK